MSMSADQVLAAATTRIKTVPAVASPSDGQVRTVEGWRQHDRSVDVRGRFLEAIKDADRHRYRQVPIDDMLTVIAILRGSADTANHAAAVEWASAIPRSSVDT